MIAVVVIVLRVSASVRFVHLVVRCQKDEASAAEACIRVTVGQNTRNGRSGLSRRGECTPHEYDPVVVVDEQIERAAQTVELCGHCRSPGQGRPAACGRRGHNHAISTECRRDRARIVELDEEAKIGATLLHMHTPGHDRPIRREGDCLAATGRVEDQPIRAEAAVG